MLHSSTSADVSCPNCGGHVYYHYPSQGVRCEDCDTVSEINPGPLPEALPLQTVIDQTEGEVLMRKVASVTCPNCGATATLSDGYDYTECVYCSSPVVREYPHEEEIIRPQAVLPFRIGPKEAKRFMIKWAYHQQKNAKAMVKALHAGSFRACYIPVWQYEAEAQVGFSDEKAQGALAREYDIPWRELDPRLYQKFQEHPMDPPLWHSALPGVSQEDFASIGPWPHEPLAAFHEAYLIGIPTFQFTTNWTAARSSFLSQAKKQLKQQDPPPPQPNLTLDVTHLNASNERLRLTLLPIFIFTLVSRRGFKNFYINGYTGKTQFEAPDWKKEEIVSRVAAPASNPSRDSQQLRSALKTFLLVFLAVAVVFGLIILYTFSKTMENIR